MKRLAIVSMTSSECRMRRTRSCFAIPALVLASWLPAPADAHLQVDVNRPRSEFECDTPVGEKWYGSTERCLEELCGGKNVYNEWIFDSDKRRRRNPCYGRNPTSVKGD
jgi:hypothetical protein